MSGGRPSLGKPLRRTPVPTATAAGPWVTSRDPLHSGATGRGAWGQSAYLPVASTSYLSLQKLVPGAQEPSLGRSVSQPPAREDPWKQALSCEHRELSRLEPSGVSQRPPPGARGVALIFEGGGVRWPSRLWAGMGSLTTRPSPSPGQGPGEQTLWRGRGDQSSLVIQKRWLRGVHQGSPQAQLGKQIRGGRALSQGSMAGTGTGPESYLRPPPPCSCPWRSPRNEPLESLPLRSRTTPAVEGEAGRWASRGSSAPVGSLVPPPRMPSPGCCSPTCLGTGDPEGRPGCSRWLQIKGRPG